MKQDNWINELSLSRPTEKTGSGSMTDGQLTEIKQLKNSGFDSNKYRKAQKTFTKLTIHELHRKHPEWGLKEILLFIINGYPSEMPADLYAEMTQFIIKKWGEIMSGGTVTA